MSETVTTQAQGRALLTPIEREESLGDRAYAALKGSLMGGGFRPYDKLTVRGIASAFEVSTTPARDAITRLVSEGALAYSGPKTVIVPPLTQPVLDEITTLRINLEGLATQTSAKYIQKQDIIALESFQENFLRYLQIGSYRDLLRWNREFHFLIYRRAGMPRLVHIIESLWLRIIPSYHELYPHATLTQEGVQHHIDAIAALTSGDGEAARHAIERDILDAYERLGAVLKSRGEARAPSERPVLP